MYVELWVASDGITAVRFADYESALVYCAETYWHSDDLMLIRFPAQVHGGKIAIEEWKPYFDPELGLGSWQPTSYGNWVWVPDLSETAMKYFEENKLLTPATIAEIKRYTAKAKKEGIPYREVAMVL